MVFRDVWQNSEFEDDLGATESMRLQRDMSRSHRYGMTTIAAPAPDKDELFE